MTNEVTLYSDTLASSGYRFKRLMLAYSNTEIEQTLRNARLLFEKLDKVLDSPTTATETYRVCVEKLVEAYKTHNDITLLKANVDSQYTELKKLTLDP